jgi:hypothetical protein
VLSIRRASKSASLFIIVKTTDGKVETFKKKKTRISIIPKLPISKHDTGCKGHSPRVVYVDEVNPPFFDRLKVAPSRCVHI